LALFWLFDDSLLPPPFSGGAVQADSTNSAQTSTANGRRNRGWVVDKAFLLED